MTTAVTSSTSVQFRHIFGINVNISDNISYLDEDVIVYVAGHKVILYSFTEKRQRCLPTEINECITSFSSGPGKKLAAIAERGGSECPSFHIWDLRTFRKKKTIPTSDVLSKDIISMHFSEDNQLILILTGAPEYTLMCYNWGKNKLIASVVVSPATSPVCRCMFSPIDSSVATIIGLDCVKFFRIGDNTMRPLQENILHGNNFICCCWMRNPDDHLLAGTDHGNIMLFRSGEFLTTLSCSPGSSYPIMSLASIPGGYVAGSGPGILFFFHYDESKDQALFDFQFSLVNTVNINDLCTGFIITIATDPKDENFTLITSCGQILTCPATNTIALLTKDVRYSITAFHGPKQITGLDVALRKPLILTCSKDNTLRLWDYRTHMIEQCKTYPEEMHSVAIHPTGLHCAVGFTDKLRIYHVLVEDLRLCMEIPIKSCKLCKFSLGGHMLAATSGNTILIFDLYTGEKVADLRGHNGKVRSLHWLPSGYQLLTSGQDGAVYLWSLDGGKRVGEFVHKGTMYTSAVAVGSSNVVVVGNDRSLRELSFPDLAPLKLNDAGLILSNIAYMPNKSVLLASTYESNKPGYIRTYTYPITGEFDDFSCTNCAISRISVTNDETFLIVGDDHGCISVLELKGRQDRFQRNNPASYLDLSISPDWSEEILVTRSELEDYRTTSGELHTKVEELKLNNEFQLKLKDSYYSDQIKETTDKFVQELELAKSKFEMLQEIRVDYEIESIEKSKYIEELHQSNVQNLETGFQAQIMEMVDSYQRLIRDRDGQIERLDEQRRQLVYSHERYVDQLTADFERKLDEEHHARLQLEDERSELNKELTEIQNQLDDDIDTEIENMKRGYEGKLSLSRETTLKYKGENGIMKKKSILMQRDIEDQKEEMKNLFTKEKELHDQIKILEKEVSAHKKEIKTRDISIGEKEKRIYELKKKNQELDKFKFVLDFKIRELKQQIEPRQMEIMAMRDKIKEMDNELESYHKSNAALDSLIGELRNKIEISQLEAKERAVQAKKLENTIQTCRSGIQYAIVHIQSPLLLVDSVKALVDRFGYMENVRPRIDMEVQDEYARHKAYLQKSLFDLKQALNEGSMKRMNANNAIRISNMSLINDINKQRELNKSLKNQIQADIGRIRYLAQAISMKKGGKSSSAGNNNKSNKNNNTPQSTKLPTLLSNYESNFASNTTTTNNNNRGAINTATTTNNNTNFTNINELLAGGGDITTTANEVIDPADLLDKNRKRITLLKQVLLDLEIKNKLLMQKALSREILPPMDGLASNINSSSIFSNNGNINANGGMLLIPPTITPPIRKSNSSQSSLKSSSSNRQKQQQQQQQQQQQSVKSTDSKSAAVTAVVKEEIVSLPSIKMNRALGMIDLEDSTSLAPLDDPVGGVGDVGGDGDVGDDGEGVGDDGGNDPDN